MTGSPSASATRWFWLLAVGLMLVEFLVFDRMTSRHYTKIYPRWNDQIQYLSESYHAYEHAKVHGLASGLKFALGKTALQGTLHDAAALLIFTVTGSASRSAALSLNMLVFLAWQAALLYTISRLTGSRLLGWMAFGLALCIAWPWSGAAGSAVDFRLDHAAMCLFGVTSCLALLTRGFRALGWSIAFGFAVGFTLLERFLTGAYFAPLFFVAALWVLFSPERWLRLRNLCFAGGIAAALALPFFWMSRTAIYNYYWVGHVTGAESAARFLGFDLWHSTRFVFGHLGDMHLGVWFGWTSAALTGLLVLFLIIHPRRRGTGFSRDWLFFGLAFLLLPAAILTLHKQKSEYVLGVLVPGVLLLVLWLWAQLWARLDLTATTRWRRALLLLPAALALGSGGYYFLQRQLRPPHSAEFLASARSVNQMADYIYDTSHSLKLTNPYIGIDQIVDYIDASILQVICYERKKVWVPFVIQLPDSILANTDEVMFYRLKLCDFVALTDEMPGDGYWPYDKQMRRLYPQFKEWCEGNLQRVDTFSLFGRRMTLYQRRVQP
ncbi:MAG: hypothetical protein KA257_01290 [Opitutaceae bacterium]|nr:hypothetical protein [Opitutaceae bacterium]